MIDWHGDFLLSTTTTYDLGPAVFIYNITIRDEGISARVTGRAEWSVDIDLGVRTVRGKAIAEIEGTIDFNIDDDGDVHLLGSLTAKGKLRFEGEDLFSGSIPASIEPCLTEDENDATRSIKPSASGMPAIGRRDSCAALASEKEKRLSSH